MALLFAVLSAVVAVARDPYALLLSCIGIAFLLLSSVLNVRSLVRGSSHDYLPVMTYFASFFVLMFLIPMTLVLTEGPRVGMYPWTLGLRLGDWPKGLLFMGIGAPFLAVGTLLGSRDPALQKHYPLSKEALTKRGRFVLYELCYVAFYYLAWEFAFRGVVLYGLLAFLPKTVTGIAVAIMIQTLLSTIFHIGHPNSEVFAAFLFGIVAGAASVVSGSILYGLCAHAATGVLNDYFAYRRLARARS